MHVTDMFLFAFEEMVGISSWFCLFCVTNCFATESCRIIKFYPCPGVSEFLFSRYPRIALYFEMEFSALNLLYDSAFPFNPACGAE